MTSRRRSGPDLPLAHRIGLNAAIFTPVLRLVLAPLPYPDPDRLVALDHGSTGLESGMGLTTGLYATYAAVSICLLAVALVACWLPARRAARLDPTTALRTD